VIRVLCVDDHAMLVEGLRAQFEIDGGIEIVGALETAEGMVEMARDLKVDAVILDVEMPGPDAFEMATRLRRTCPETRVMILSAHVRDGFISAAFAAGASAYFAKSDEVEDIVNGVRLMLKEGAPPFIMGPMVLLRCHAPGARKHSSTAGKVASHAGTAAASGEPATLLGSLTAREAEVLRLIGKGLPRTQIAALLFRSVKTIDGHQDRMMKKLGIGSRADLMRFAIREGLAQA